MSAGTFYPAASGDDGNCPPLGAYDSSGNFLYLGAPGGTSYENWIRFLAVNIPQGSTITGAFIRLTCVTSGSDVTCNLNLYFNDADDAVAPVDKTAFQALSLTGAIAWNDLTAWTDGVQYDSPSLVSILQTVVDRGGWAADNAVQVVIKDNASSSNADRRASSIDIFSGTEKVELHVEWTLDNEREISENVNVLSEFGNNLPEIDENINVSSEFASRLSTVWIGEDVNVNTEFEVQDLDLLNEEVSVNTGMEGFYTGDISEDVSVNSGFISEHTGSILENASVASEFTSAHTGDLSEEASVNSEFVGVKFLTKTISETLSAWETLSWGWNKTVLDSMAIADTAEKILGIPVRDWITFTDTQINNWNGSEAISDSFYAVDIPKVIQIYRDLVKDGMAIADAVNLALQLVITDILTCTDTIIDTGTFQHSIEDGMTLADVVKRFFPKSISDSFTATDTSLFDFLAFLQIADSLSITEITTPGLTINQTIADALAMADTIALQQFLQELIQDGLNIEVIVELDGELWECWCLNCSSFHPSVYSGYDYNSFAEFNNTVYGAKSDGIYELAGDTDNGTEFHSGIVLPQTNFGSAHNKRFRKAWFGVSGDNLTMKMETKSGSKAFAMTDMEMSITRNLKGRKWVIKLQDFDELDMAELYPVILSRK